MEGAETIEKWWFYGVCRVWLSILSKLLRRLWRPWIQWCWKYFCIHRMCDRQGNKFRTPTDGHQNNGTILNLIQVSKRNCPWHIDMVSTTNSNVTDNTNSITPSLLCSSTIDPSNNTTIIVKEESCASNNYWSTEDIIVLTDITAVSNGPIK